MRKSITLLSIAITVLGIFLAINSFLLEENNDRIILDFTETFREENEELSAFRKLFYSFAEMEDSADPRKASLDYCFENFNSIEFKVASTTAVDQLNGMVQMGSGSFIIKCKDRQEVHGSFEGFADQSISREDVMIYLTVEGGTGKFELSSGYLKIKIDHSDPKANEGVISVKGKINLGRTPDPLALASL